MARQPAPDNLIRAVMVAIKDGHSEYKIRNTFGVGAATMARAAQMLTMER
jgi:hypothetical protein